MKDLSKIKCAPCSTGVGLLSPEEIDTLADQITGWRIVKNHHLAKEYKTSEFADGLEWVNRVGALAEKEGHHPDIELSWGRVAIKLTTHDAGGLTRNDFILAAKIDRLKPPGKRP